MCENSNLEVRKSLTGSSTTTARARWLWVLHGSIWRKRYTSDLPQQFLQSPHDLCVHLQVPVTVMRLHERGCGGINGIAGPLLRAPLDQGEIVVREQVPPSHEVPHSDVLLDVAELQTDLLADLVPGEDGFWGSQVVECYESLDDH